jgi:hypothetical protein
VTRRGYLLLGALTASPGCLLYTDAINHPPVVVTLMGPEKVNRGGSAVFDASVEDPDQAADSLLVEWRSQPPAKTEPPCPASGGKLEAQGPAAEHRRLTLKVDAPLCVSVVVTDERGAPASSVRLVKVENQDPIAAIDVAKARMAPGGLFELYSAIQLTGSKSTDPENDPLTFTWTVMTPDGKSRPAASCPQLKDDACESLALPGRYTFTLQVRDELGGIKELSRPVEVGEDRPPCIETTTPDFRLPSVPQPSSMPLRFEVGFVDDDGEPYPEAADRSRMVWEWRFDAMMPFSRQVGPMSQPALEFQSSDLAAHAGRTLSVRLTYQDRVMRDLSKCAGDRCEVQPDTRCYQRVSWTVPIF